MRKAIVVFCAAFVAALISCGGPSAAEKKVERERLAEARIRLEVWETKLAASDGKGEDAVECLRSILGIQAMELDEVQAVIDRFDANKDLLEGDTMARIYDAVARSKMAGVSRKIEDKMSWLRQGMASFEALRDEYPDDEYVFLYQASTYAAFPVEVGAKADVLDILSEILDRYGSLSWSLGQGQAGQLIWIFNTLRGNYSDDQSIAEIEEVESAFRSTLPAYEAAYKQNAAEAERE